jgi:transposase
MSRRQKYPLRPRSVGERQELDRLSRSHSEPAGHVARTQALLAVAQGASYTAAARLAGRKSGDAVSYLVRRFNVEGLQAVAPRHGGGPQMVYGPAERERILAAARRQPDRERDGTATWSMTSLQRALRQQDMPKISTYTIWHVLTAAGLRWQHNRTWCATGTVWRKRKGRMVLVHDPDTEAKKN